MRGAAFTAVHPFGKPKSSYIRTLGAQATTTAINKAFFALRVGFKLPKKTFVEPLRARELPYLAGSPAQKRRFSTNENHKTVTGNFLRILEQFSNHKPREACTRRRW